MSNQQQIESAQDYFTGLVRALYQLGDGRDGSGTPSPTGLSEAARVMGILTCEQVQQIIDATP